MKKNMWPKSAGAFAAGVTLVGLVTVAIPATAEETVTVVRASVTTGGGESFGYPVPVEQASTSADGRFTVFGSDADDLVPGDTNNTYDVFLRDEQENLTTRISVSTAGEQSRGNSAWSGNPSMSADGRYVIFESLASNLVPEDGDTSADVFLRDTVTGETTLVSTDGSSGKPRFPFSGDSAISADGRFAAYETTAALVGGDTDSERDVYLKELATGRTVRISEPFDGQPLRDPYRGFDSLAVSPDGSHVLFSSAAENLVPGDTNGTLDVFVRDVAAGTTVRASVTGSGAQIDGASYGASMSADGRRVAFRSSAKNLQPGVLIVRTQVFVRDLAEKTTTIAGVREGATPQGAETSEDSDISPDGRHLVFQVIPSPGAKAALYVRDLDNGATRPLVTSLDGSPLDGDTTEARFSPGGHHVSFASDASNLVPGDTNGVKDIFVRLNVL